MNYLTIIGIAVPFIGTTLGAALVFFLKNNINKKLQKLLLGFAAGVMIAASIWSLIIPSIEKSSHLGKLNFLPAVVGFILGMLFLLFLDKYINKCNVKNKKTNMLYLAVTMHNIPEGMAVGVTFASAFLSNTGITLASALALAIGIAIQNFPEGAIISMPLKSQGMSKTKAFFYGAISGVVEPISSLITILLTNYVVPILPYLLSFAAGAMIYVVVEELIPESQAGHHSNLGTIGVAIGFVLMMVLDIALG